AQASARRQVLTAIKPDPEIKVRTLLDRAAARIEGRFDQQPLVEASLRRTIGWTYRELGLSAGLPHLERAVELYRHHRGEEHSKTREAEEVAAGAYVLDGNYAKAEKLYTKVADSGSRAQGEEAPNTLMAMHNRALL